MSAANKKIATRNSYVHQEIVSRKPANKSQLISLTIVYILGFAAFAYEKGAYVAIWITATLMAIGLNTIVVLDLITYLRTRRAFDQKSLVFVLAVLTSNCVVLFAVERGFVTFLIAWSVAVSLVGILHAYFFVNEQ